MFGIFDKIEEFFRELLLGGIKANLESMFLDINNQVNSVAADVGKTPMGWNGEVFSFIKNINDCRYYSHSRANNNGSPLYRAYQYGHAKEQYARYGHL